MSGVATGGARPAGDETVRIREYRPGDEEGILDCYNRIFPTPDGRIPPRTRAHFDWKFRRNPTGRVQHVVVEHAAEGIIGGYAGIPVRVWSEQREQLAAQGVDLMVLPRWRRHGPRPGLFVYLGWKYHELFCGAGEGKVLFTYGWPIPAWRMGQRYLGYLNIRDWDFLFRETAAPGFTPRSVPVGLEVRQVQRYGADVDALFAALRPGMGLALIRDARYLNWRYAERPDHSYRLYECRDASGALRGVCVYTLSDFLHPHTAFLVDWLAPAHDHDAAAAMVGALEHQAVADRANALAAIFNQVDPRFLAFQRLGFLVQGTPYFVVLASFKYDTLYYREQWYYTMGDSDLI